MTPVIYGVHHVIDTYYLGSERAAELIAKAAEFASLRPNVELGIGSDGEIKGWKCRKGVKLQKRKMKLKGKWNWKESEIERKVKLKGKWNWKKSEIAEKDEIAGWNYRKEGSEIGVCCILEILYNKMRLTIHTKYSMLTRGVVRQEYFILHTQHENRETIERETERV